MNDEYAYVPHGTELHDALAPILHAETSELFRIVRRECPSASSIAALLILFDRAKRPLVTNYDHYLRSDQWKATREKKLEAAGRQCALCPTTSRLQIHHRTYERIGREHLSDLIVLCGECHARHHGKLAAA